MSDEPTQAEAAAAPEPVAEAPQGPSLLEEITQETKRKPSDADYGMVRRGVEVLLGELLKPKRLRLRRRKSRPACRGGV